MFLFASTTLCLSSMVNFIFVAFNSHKEWKKMQRVSAPSDTILPTKAGTFS